MSIWTDLAGMMDETVDAMLGDTISYSVDGVTFADIQGFVLFPQESDGFSAIDEMPQRYRVKLAKAVIARPMSAHRLTCIERLGAGTWQPSAAKPSDTGRYWIFDIKRV